MHITLVRLCYIHCTFMLGHSCQGSHCYTFSVDFVVRLLIVSNDQQLFPSPN